MLHKSYLAHQEATKGHDLSAGIARIDMGQLTEAVDIGLGLAIRELEEEFRKLRDELQSDNVHRPNYSHAETHAPWVVSAAKRLEALVKAAHVLHGAETRADVILCNRPPLEALTMSAYRVVEE